MIESLVTLIKDTAEHIDGVKTFEYESSDLFNTQGNNAPIQLYVESDIYSQYLVTKDLLKVTMNVVILDKCYQKDELLEVQDRTTKIGIVLLTLLNRLYSGQLDVYDYSFLNLDRYTDDEMAGCRLTIYLLVPSPISVCNLDDYINELNEYEKKDEQELDVKVPKIDISTININPVKVERNGKR